MNAETFAPEMREAARSYDKYIVCVGKTPDEFGATILSLVGKAIEAYQTRIPGMRHGIALDPLVTVILSQNIGDEARPLCGIYFNLHTPYPKRRVDTKPKA